MGRDERAARWSRLEARGLVSGALEEAAGEDNPYVRLVLGVSAWIATLCILSGVGCLFGACLWESVGRGGLVVFGLGLLGAAFGAYVAAGHNPFGRQLGLSLSLAGQAVFLSGVGSLVIDGLDGDSGRALALVMGGVGLGMEAALIALIAERAHRAVCAMLAVFALMSVAWGIGAESLAGPLVLAAWLSLYAAERRLLALHEVVAPVRWGLALGLAAPLCWGYALRLGLAAHMETAPALVWIGEGAMALVCLVALWRWQPRAGAKPRWALPVALVLSPLAVFAPGLSAALALIAAGFERRERRVIVLGLLALCCALGSYYYALALTLKTKALILMALGAALLIVRRLALSEREVGDA